MFQHVDRFPRTVLRAQCTTDTARQIHFNQLSQVKVFRSGHNLNAINRTNDDTHFATGTAILIDHCKLLRLLFSRRLVRIVKHLRNSIGSRKTQVNTEYALTRLSVYVFKRLGRIDA
jgi:hypothetical protein